MRYTPFVVFFMTFFVTNALAVAPITLVSGSTSCTCPCSILRDDGTIVSCKAST
ncbi:hypothetical protein GALMADRAFT_1160374 [Galerina marginata CBS 339.88]|uniref:Uncharacterized protein n=1 Tax=Galerina marginata (strain CBS 339.88) TaxID=685588 RepID=A0A067SI20_GALM3|nr:hypothetical protein GALMADRAFT_1160374 [Galerina marginata CBS 339.88]